jgi:hypothetical protein
MLAKTGSAITVSGSTFSGGADYPSGLIDYHTGNELLAIAADRWTADRTAALDAIRDIVRTEQGRFFVQRDGTLTFYDRRWFFTPLTPALSLDADPFTTQVGLEADQVYNLVNVTVRPRATAGAVDVLARSTSVIRIPPLSASEPGTRTITLYFRDGAGNVVGGTGLVLPLVAGTDFSVNDRADGTGFDYTSSPAFVIGPLDMRGSEVRITFYNYAIGPLYVTKLQVRGQAVTVYDPVTQTREDTTSQSTYLKRML